VCEAQELASSHGFGMWEGAGHGLVLAIGIVQAQLWLPPTVLSDPEGLYYRVQVGFSFRTTQGEACQL
jgi:hypothetical protein